MIFKQLQIIILSTLLILGAMVTQANAEESADAKPAPVEVSFETSMGPFTLELFPDKAPQTVANFLMYVDEGFYDNTLFHRVIPGFVVQAGGFEKDMKKKLTHPPVKNESANGLMNIRGAISMARTNNPDSATSQFFINVVHNPSLDSKGKKPGYAVFGKVTDGIKIIDKIISVPTERSGRHSDVPKKDVFILSAKRKGGAVANSKKLTDFVAGEHYVVLDKPVATRDSKKIEVIQLFSYACSNCYEIEPMIKEWSKQQSSDVDFRFFPAIWSKAMKLYAKAFYTAKKLNVLDKIHQPLFTAIVIDQKGISTMADVGQFFTKHGVNKRVFTRAYTSAEVKKMVKQAEENVRKYKIASVPEVIVNGKYRVDRMRAGGNSGMLAVIEHLVKKERALLKK